MKTKQKHLKARIHDRKLKGSRGPKFAPFALRSAIYQRDAGQCQYCGKEVSLAECNIDHVFPYHRGGPTRRENLVVACRDCNRLKYGQVIPEGLGPLDGLKEGTKEVIQIIRTASIMGILLDDIFPPGLVERLAMPQRASPL